MSGSWPLRWTGCVLLALVVAAAGCARFDRPTCMLLSGEGERDGPPVRTFTLARADGRGSPRHVRAQWEGSAIEVLLPDGRALTSGKAAAIAPHEQPLALQVRAAAVGETTLRVCLLDARQRAVHQARFLINVVKLEPLQLDGEEEAVTGWLGVSVATPSIELDPLAFGEDE